MKTKITTAAIALALVGAFAAPASAAQAASATVSGTVEYHGAPVAGILVGWFKPSTGTYKVVTSGADGSYSLPLPGAGQKYVMYGNLKLDDAAQGRGDKKYVGVYYGDGDTRDYAFQTLDRYTAASADDTLDIELAKPGSISGLDTNLNGDFTLQNLGGGDVKEMTDATESLGFSNLFPGQYRIVPSSPYRSQRVSDDVITVTEGAQTVYAPNPQDGGEIKGVVSDSTGKGIRNIFVSATGPGDDLEDSDYTYTDSQGRYHLRNLHSSSYTVTFGSPATIAAGQRGYVMKEQTVEGITEDVTTRVNVSLKTGGRIRGTLPDATGTGYVGLTLVGPAGDIIETDQYVQEGSFTYGSLPTGTYTLYSTKDGSSKYRKATFTVTAGKTVDLGTFSRTTTGRLVSGTVTALPAGWAKGEPVYVSASADDRPSAYARVHSNGTYSLKGVVPGTYTVTVGRSGHEDSTATVTVTANRTKTLKLGKRFGTVTADVTIAGVPVPAGELYLSNEESRYPAYAFYASIADGRLSAEAPARSYDTVDYLMVPDLFQANSPYWIALPDGALPITVTAGEDKDLGTIALDVRPELQPLP